MITYSNTAKLLFAQSSNSNVANIKSSTSQKSSAPDFKSVFDSVTKSPVMSTNSDKVVANYNTQKQADTTNVKYKSFNDVKAKELVTSAAKQDAVAQPKDDTKIMTVDAVSDEETKKPDLKTESSNDVINVLAQMLGIQPNDLIKLANQLGFKAEDLKDTKQLGAFVDELANVLNLTVSQKEMLTSLFQEVSKQVKTKENSTEQVSGIDLKTDAESVASVDSGANTIDISKISEKVKTKLQDFIVKVNVNSDTVSTEVSKVIEAMKANAGNLTAAKINNADAAGQKTETTDVEQPEGDNPSEVKVYAKDTKKAENRANADSGKAKTEAEKTEPGAKTVLTAASAAQQSSVESNQNSDQSQQMINASGDVKVNIINNSTTVEKPALEVKQPAVSSEVINQVVENAKVLVGQDKSEMVIHLKPDHLGKLELKVVTEQGIVAAKFIAENQQVKEVIESNMQLLKDSLQKQGLSVDGVSVQVGHQNQNEYQRQSTYSGKNNGSNSSSKYAGNSIGVSKTGMNLLETLPERLAQYAFESSTINLTA